MVTDFTSNYTPTAVTEEGQYYWAFGNTYIDYTDESQNDYDLAGGDAAI